MNKDETDAVVKGDDRDAGYSLLEILVVLAIIGTLMTLVAPRLLGNVDKSNVIAAKAQTRTLRLALDSYSLDMGGYPSPTVGLNALIEPPQGQESRWFGPYLDDAVPLDPWNTPFIYQPPEALANGRMSSPRVVSLGADKAPGGEGLNEDISS